MAPHANTMEVVYSSSQVPKGRSSPKSKAMVSGKKIAEEKLSPASRAASDDLSGKRYLAKTPLANLLNKNQGKGEGNLMLVTIVVLGSPGPLRFLVDRADTVGRVVDTALRVYAREGRLPLLNKHLVELYCDNGDFKALDPKETVGDLGTRQFLLYRKKPEEVKRTASVETISVHPLKHWWSFMSSLVCSH